MSRAIFIVVACALAVAGCSGNGGPLTAADWAAAGWAASGGASAGKPLSLTRQGDSTPAAGGTVRMAVDKVRVARAVERYQVNTGKPAGDTRIAGADLNGDGKPEALVLVTGADWCVASGCTLLVMRKGQTGFELVNKIDRVRAPVAISSESRNGWRSLMLSTGGQSVDKQRLVLAAFSGNGYPRNASVLSPAGFDGAGTPEIVIAPRRVSPAATAQLPATTPAALALAPGTDGTRR